jgi:hypothetical protein
MMQVSCRGAINIIARGHPTETGWSEQCSRGRHAAARLCVAHADDQLDGRIAALRQSVATAVPFQAKPGLGQDPPAKPRDFVCKAGKSAV